MFKRNSIKKRISHKPYESRVYHNPYFQKQKKNYRKIGWGIGSLIFVFLFLTVYLLTYPAFNISHVQVVGLEPETRPQFEENINDYFHTTHALFFENKNRFLFSTSALQKSLSKKFTFEFLDIKISRQTVSLHLKERETEFMWKTGSTTYLVDKEGILLHRVDTEQKNVVPLPSRTPQKPLFVDRNNTPVETGEHVLSEKEIQQIFVFIETLKTQSIFTKEIQIDQLAGKWRGILTTEGYTILFDPSSDVLAQSEKLKTLLRDTIKDPSKLKYIDLRFGDHLYYK